MRCGRRRRSSGSSPTAGSGMVLDVWTTLGRTATAVGRGQARGRPILDIGVGGGRTTSLLRLVSDELRRHRLHARLVAACRRNLPRCRCALRYVSRPRRIWSRPVLAAVFSYNGLDAVDTGGPGTSPGRVAGFWLRVPARLLDPQPGRSVLPCHPVAPGRVARGHTPGRGLTALLRASAAVVQQPRALARRS